MVYEYLFRALTFSFDLTDCGRKCLGRLQGG